MDALTAAARTADPIGAIPANFMLDGATYERGGALGVDGVDFYFIGRGGALGDVGAPVVVAAMVFFEPSTVTAGWDRARKVLSPKEGAQSFIGCAHAWAESHLPDGPDYARLAALESRVISAASRASAPLFAAWADWAEPQSPKALALQRMNVLRELRGGVHGGAAVAAGLSPQEAVSFRSPYMSGIFGWGDPLPNADQFKAAWELAEEGTNRAMARYLAVLDPAELDELVELLAGAHSGA